MDREFAARLTALADDAEALVPKLRDAAAKLGEPEVPPPVPEGPPDILSVTTLPDGRITVRTRGIKSLDYVLVEAREPHRWIGRPMKADTVNDMLVIPKPDYGAVGQFVKVLASDNYEIRKDAMAWIGDNPHPGNPPTTGGGLALARAFHEKCFVGLNFERDNFAHFTIDAGFADYMLDIGMYGRCFMPWKPDGAWWDNANRPFWDLKIGVAPTKEQFSRFFPPLKVLTGRGVPMAFDLMDFIELRDLENHGAIVDEYIRAAGTWIKEAGFDPKLLVVGPVNEYAGENNAIWQPHRMRLMRILREALPEPWVLGQAPCEWGHWSSYTGDDRRGPYIPGDDKAVINWWHAYDSRTKEEWEWVQAGINKWSNDNGGLVVMNGELGAGSNGMDFNADGGWVEHIRRQNPALANSAPCYWAATRGSAWRLNRADWDPRPWNGTQGWDPNIEGAIEDAGQANRRVRD